MNSSEIRQQNHHDFVFHGLNWGTFTVAACISRQRMKAESALLQVGDGPGPNGESPQLFGVARWGDGEPMVIMGLPFGLP
jgi:hypothetical protein